MQEHSNPGYSAGRAALRKKLSSTAFQALRSFGVFSLAGSSRRRKNSLLILCYHGLSLQDEHEWLPQLYITPAKFRERMQALRKADATVLPFGEALERLRLGCLPPRSVAITFDDGFYDYLATGLPILQEYKYPSTVYLTTHYCHYRLPIVGLVLDYILWKSGRAEVSLPEYGVLSPEPVRIYAQRQKLVKRLLKWAETNGLDTIGKDQIAQSIARSLEVDYNLIRQHRMLQILSPAEVQLIGKAGVNVQLHTHRHRVPRDLELFTKEIEENRRDIIDLTGTTPTHFCYPSGDYSSELFGWLADCGVLSATTCEAGLAERNSNAMKLPRVLDHSGLSAPRFESMISGLLV